MKDMAKSDISIDWGWVRDNVMRSEKIPAGRIKSCLEVCLKKAKALAHPKSLAVEKKILSNASGSIRLEDDIEILSRTVSSHLKGAGSLAVFLVTIGKTLEDEASGLMKKNDELSGYLMDRIGSFAVESLAQNLEEYFRKSLVSKGLSLSIRFSPGYCDWRIEEQFKLSRIADFSEAGIALTENCMMVPRKSISAVAGIGPKGLFSKSQSQCAICNMRDCTYKRGS